jgi:hypothetical protein
LAYYDLRIFDCLLGTLFYGLWVRAFMTSRHPHHKRFDQAPAISSMVQL